MFDKLNAVETRYEQLTALLANPSVQADPSAYRTHAKALAELQPLVERFREFKAVVDEIEQARELAGGDDAEMRALALDELKTLEARRDVILGDSQAPAHAQGPERREERHARDPGGHGRRRGRAVRGRSVPDVHALRRAPGLAGRH